MDIYNEAVNFLSNPFVSLIGYIVGFISGVIAIFQFLTSKELKREVRELTKINNNLIIENNNLKLTINNIVSQGEKSQYFQTNNGPVNIDVR
ncbi:Uncharacterised protein [Yersinia enterocolitica]|uniref:Uncharacterized protein n=1 Tax=Yersinia enterocolitica TaxID=630 RepID=A0A9P1M221_YEREN|nr:Uncharacterised protein [Yersinia enterocolitica]